MYYIMRILEFFNTRCVWILSALFGALLLFAVANWLYDPYRKQNKKLRECTQNMRAYPAKTSLYMARLPEDYHRQWRAFVNCGTDKPALVFEFVPRKKRLLLPLLLALLTVTVSLYTVVFALVELNVVYLVVQVVYWLALTLILLADNALCRRYARNAKQTFGKMVAQLSAVTPKNRSTVAQDTVKALNKLNKTEVTDQSIGKASEILRGNGLDAERTADEQRRVNLALNGLLQAYADSARNKPV